VPGPDGVDLVVRNGMRARGAPIDHTSM
jgi:hypothetical protein